LQVKGGVKKRAGTKTGPYYTNYYTNVLRKRLLHGCDRAVLHVGQDVAVGVECYRDDDSKVQNNLSCGFALC
jgi:hypothetical protein